MVNTYYTLRALVDEWAPELADCIVGDVFSQERGELTLALADPENEWMLRVSTQAPHYFVFRSEGYSKARRNVATLFESTFGRRVTTVRVAERDRMLFLELEDGSYFQVVLFGPRANVFLVTEGGIIAEAFRSDAAWRGKEAQKPRAAPRVTTIEAFEARWRTNRKTAAQALASAMPLFDGLLARETLHRAGVPDRAPDALTEAERHRLFETALALEEELQRPTPRIYWRDRFADAFSLCPLYHKQDREELFETVDEAVRVFVRRTLAQRRFRQAYEPLEKALEKAHEDAVRRTERMLEELSQPSRADRYERWAHLLMASPRAAEPGSDAVTLPDLFEEGRPVRIPLDPAHDAVQNARRYYDKARRTRQARARAEERILEAEAQAERAADLLKRLREIEDYRALERFRKEEADALAEVVGGGAGGREELPFRRFSLGNGYEVWVGKNARQNDALTFRHAQKYDLWMHARGVPGSHTVLRLPHRNAQPDRHVVERAAAIAAYFSKARGSSLVPVMVAPRKYVRKPKGAPPGAVVVEREEVLMVEPELPV